MNWKQIKQTVKKLIWIANQYDIQMTEQRLRIEQAEKTIRDRTEIHVDLSVVSGGVNQIIVAGRYRDKDYVQVFSVCSEDFQHIVEILRHMQKYGQVKRIDAAPGWSAVVKRELGFKY